MLEIIIKRIIENEARELYNSLIKPDIVVLGKSTSRGKDKKNSILNIFNNLESAFTGIYLHYGDVPKPETKFGESIAERTKLKKQKSAEQSHEYDS